MKREHKGNPITRGREFLARDLWFIEAQTQGRLQSLLTRISRILVLTARNFRLDACSQRAAALTYITIFSLPPVLAVVFAVASGLGFFEDVKKNAINPFLDRTFGESTEEPGEAEAGSETAAASTTTAGGGAETTNGDAAQDTTGDAPVDATGDTTGDTIVDATEVASSTPTEDAASESQAFEIRAAVDKIFEFVEEPDPKLFLGLGGILLLYSVLKMLGSVEMSLNHIWGVKRARTFIRKGTDYLSIVVVTPFFLTLGTAITAWLEKEVPTGLGIVKLIPFLSIGLGMAFLYLTLPNTTVRVPSALVGGLTAGLLWHVAQWGHVKFQIGLAKYEAIYSTFAAIPMLLLWLYVSWLILLVGAELAYAHQSVKQFTTITRTGTVDQAYREQLAPRVAGHVANAFLAGHPAPTADELAELVGVAPRPVLGLLEHLADRGLLARSAREDSSGQDGYLPSRDPDTITIVDLQRALRSDPDAEGVPVHNRYEDRVARILASLAAEEHASLHNHTLRELARLVESEQEEALPGDAGAQSPTPSPSV